MTNTQSFLVSLIMTGLKLTKSNILENKNRKNILKLLMDNELKISDIQKKLNLNYKTIWDHISTLEKNSFVILKKEEKETGKPVYVKLNIGVKEYLLNPKSFEKDINDILNKFEYKK